MRAASARTLPSPCPMRLTAVLWSALAPAVLAQPWTRIHPPGELRLIPGPPPVVPAPGNPTLKHLSLPAHLREIGSRGLAGCSALIRLELPPSLIQLGTRTFDHCGALTRILLPEGLTRLPGLRLRGLPQSGVHPHPLHCDGHRQSVLLQLHPPAPPGAAANLDSIGSGMLMNCSRLQSLSFPAGDQRQRTAGRPVSEAGGHRPDRGPDHPSALPGVLL